MIWQLVKRDPAWEMALWLIPLAALDARTTDGSTVVGYFVMFLFFGRVYERANLFTAALPVSARQIFLARVLAILSLVWIPIGVASATLWVLQRPYGIALSIFEGGTHVTALSVSILCLYPRRFQAPLPSVAAVGAVAILFFNIMTALPWSREAIAIVSTIFAVAVFLFAWKTIPLSFQAAPERPAGRALAAADGSPAGVWWLPVGLSLFPVSVLLPMFAITQPPSGQWLFGGLFGVGIAGGYVTIQRSCRWIRTLPIHPGSTMLVILAVYLVPFTVSVLMSPFYWPADFGIHFDRFWLLNTAALLCWTLLGVNSLLILHHWRFQRLNRSVKWTLGTLLILPQLIPLNLGFYKVDLHVLARTVPLQLSSLTRAPLWQFMALTAIPAGLLCWTACKIFEGVEITGRGPASVWDFMKTHQRNS
jgi:hypothetical protein